ncbi:hypothetical protein LX87_01676 [Larkinella arboricola]|uniref:Uncharacterized protein n=1 Tax=Larkinella arboricola TaxID=643671 RepID=A0A327X2V2_LARAB|nr:hypothetical protein [Larkinella arboricola]RAJ99978.1 hypothetical protein LX87_01676 [Larkinella arboricola]
MIANILLPKETIWFLLILSIGLISCDAKKQASKAEKASSKKTLRISSRDTIQATDLFEYYLHSLALDKEKEAQRMLKGKKFYIKGRIKIPDKEWKDRLEYVQLRAHQKYNTELILCHLTNNIDREKLSILSENTSVILFGEYIGYNHFPTMKDCHLVSVTPLK